jgi:hypothetical protein
MAAGAEEKSGGDVGSKGSELFADLESGSEVGGEAIGKRNEQISWNCEYDLI